MRRGGEIDQQNVIMHKAYYKVTALLLANQNQIIFSCIDKDNNTQISTTVHQPRGRNGLILSRKSQSQSIPSRASTNGRINISVVQRLDIALIIIQWSKN